MEYVSLHDRVTLSPLPTTLIHEYETQDPDISFGLAEIDGRYPATGFAFNQKAKELVYVISGQGKIIRQEEVCEIAAGDVILLQPNEPFAWEGQLVLAMTTTPRFDPAQHVCTDEAV